VRYEPGLSRTDFGNVLELIDSVEAPATVLAESGGT